MGENNSVEITDVEGYGKEDDVVFSHQTLVMKAMKRCIELGNQELHEGVNKEQVDSRSGKAIIVHQTDQRITFINSIKMCKSTMICDFDETMKTGISTLKTKFDKDRTKILKGQNEMYEKLDEVQRKNLGLFVYSSRHFHPRLPFLKEYKELEVDFYRGLFEELTLLTERKQFYASERAEA